MPQRQFTSARIGNDIVPQGNALAQGRFHSFLHAGNFLLGNCEPNSEIVIQRSRITKCWCNIADTGIISIELRIPRPYIVAAHRRQCQLRLPPIMVVTHVQASQPPRIIHPSLVKSIRRYDQKSVQHILFVDSFTVPGEF
jgi:hypothetical protein